MSFSPLKFVRCAVVLIGSYAVAMGTLFAASPPPNDLCTGSTVIPPSGPFPYLSPTVDITAATTSGDPVLSPTNTDCYQVVSRGVWYKFTPGSTAFYVASVNDTATTVSDTLMAIYTSGSGCGGPFTLVACNDDTGGDTRSAIAANLISSTSYYIVVWKVLTNAPFAGETTLQLKISRPAIPTNDVCSGAEVIPSSGPFPYLTAVTDIIGATSAGDPPDPSCQLAGFRSIWYRFTPSASGDYVFTTVPFTATRVVDTVMAIYKATGCGGPYTEVACNDDAVGYRAAVTVPLTAATAYFVAVWDFDEFPTPGFTTVQLGVSKPPLPTVTTLMASNVSSSTVILNASVTPNADNEPTRIWFQWGTATNYGNSSAQQTISSNLVNAGISIAAVVNPSANTLYHFRAAAGHSKGTNFGGDQTFLWSNARPHIESLILQPGGAYRLQFTGNPSQLYQIQASQSLTNWVDLGPPTDLGAALFEFIDSDAMLFQRSFYRTRAP